MRAYYFDNLPGDQRLPHDCIPSRPVSEENLQKLGWKQWHIPVEGHEPIVDEVSRTRGYKYRDSISLTKAGLGETYEAKLKTFFEEHMHEEEEIRYILQGSGFWDVRDTHTDAWIRVAVSAGDLIVLPAGIYHRFTLDETNAIEALLFFKEEPKRIAHNRGEDTEASAYRKAYLQSIGVGA